MILLCTTQQGDTVLGSVLRFVHMSFSLLKIKVCFIIVSSPIERASRNSTYETPQLTQIITPDSSP